MGLGSKGAGSREVPFTTLPSRTDGVVQRAPRVCRRNPLFAKALYRSGAAFIPYSLPNPPSGPSTGRKIHFCCGLRTSGSREVCLKKEEDDHGPLDHQRTSRLSDGPFCSLPGALHANMRPSLSSQIVLFVEFFTKTSLPSL